MSVEPVDKKELIKTIIKEAHYRPVIPFVGSGISIAAGFPTIRFLIHYLAKVDFAIRHGVFQDRFPFIDNERELLQEYIRHPSKYLKDFGWPNLGQIDADLWSWIAKTKDEAQAGEKKEQTSKIKDDFINDIVPNVNNSTGIVDNRDYLRVIVQWTLRLYLAEKENGSVDGVFDAWLDWKKWYVGKSTKEQALLYGDWEMLLDKLSEGNANLTDMLFTAFENGLEPTLSHRLLAFLQAKLGISLVLTTNFDSLLERAFHDEGLRPKVFDVHKDADLPEPALIHRQLSVIKLHGSAYGLRFGERLQYALESGVKNDALRYIPSNALILVLGFSGSERRIMQMLQAFAHGDGEKPRLIWIQGPSEPGPLFKELFDDSCKNVQWCRVKHADTFLQELYFNMASSHQSSHKGYSSLPGQLRMTDVALKMPNQDKNLHTNDKFKSFLEGVQNGYSLEAFKELEEGKEKEDIVNGFNRVLNRYPVQVFIANDNKPSSSWGTLAGVAFTQSLGQDHMVIWIDLENHHTVEGIISDFFHQVRKIDPSAPTCSITDLHKKNIEDGKVDDVDKKVIKKAVARIGEVFQRGRYVLVLDSIESFGRPQMVHHGIRSYKSGLPT